MYFNKQEKKIYFKLWKVRKTKLKFNLIWDFWSVSILKCDTRQQNKLEKALEKHDIGSKYASNKKLYHFNASKRI